MSFPQACDMKLAAAWGERDQSRLASNHHYQVHPSLFNRGAAPVTPDPKMHMSSLHQNEKILASPMHFLNQSPHGRASFMMGERNVFAVNMSTDPYRKNTGTFGGNGSFDDIKYDLGDLKY
jgi:hypothetical protein